MENNYFVLLPFQIIVKEGNKISQRNAVTTSILKKVKGEWYIVVMHFISRK